MVTLPLILEGWLYIFPELDPELLEEWLNRFPELDPELLEEWPYRFPEFLETILTYPLGPLEIIGLGAQNF